MHQKSEPLPTTETRLPTLRRLVFTGLFLGSLMAASAEALDLSGDLSVAFDNYGAIKKILSNGDPISGKGLLMANRTGHDGMFQGWETVEGDRVHCEIANGTMTATGTLVQRDAPEVPQVSFKVTYKKKGEGVLSIACEATYRSNETVWTGPAQYYILLPVDSYQGAKFTFEAPDGKEQEFTIGRDPLDMRTYGSGKLTIANGKQKIEIAAADDTQLSGLDGRNWGGDYIRINIDASRRWSREYDLPNGQKDEFAATLTFKN